MILNRTCFFVSDLHGATDRYEKLFRAMENERPAVVFLGGDLLPSFLAARRSRDGSVEDFIHDFLRPGLRGVQESLGREYPALFLILGNDDLRVEETSIEAGGSGGLWQYVHDRRVRLGEFTLYGYSFVPPTPFSLKDWERYDVSQYVDPGCTHPTEGRHSVSVTERELKYATIREDLEKLAGNDDLGKSVFLFHTPPHDTCLDRAALDGKMIEHVPLDVHVGSIAVRRFIEARQPYLTLHGHVHESARLTGSWKQFIGKTLSISAAHDGPELCLVRFSLEHLESATRELI
jgi:uncharacterized protein